MADMMLTGRVLSAEEAAQLGLVHYLVEEGAGLYRAMDLARQIAANSPLTNYAVIQALPRIAEASPETGLLLESLMAAVAQSSTETKDRMNAFLTGRAARINGRGAAR